MLKVIKKDEHIKQVVNESKDWFKAIPHEECLLVVLGKEKNDLFSRLLHTDDSVHLYYRKKERLYEKELKFNLLSNTLIEFFMAQTEPTLLHVSESFYFLEPFFQKPILPSVSPSIIGLPLYNQEDLIGIIVFYTALQQLDPIMEELNSTIRLTAKLLQQAMVLDQVLPNELNEWKERIRLRKHSVLVNQEKRLAYVSEDLLPLLDIQKELITTDKLDEKIKVLSNHQLVFQESVEIDQVKLSMFEVKKIEVSAQPSVVPQTDYRRVLEVAQTQKQKKSVFAIKINSNPKTISWISYAKQDEFFQQVFAFIDEFFNKTCVMGPWLNKGTVVVVDGTLDERIMKRFIESLSDYVLNHPINQDQAYDVYIGSLRFGKEAKLTNDLFTPIDVLFDYLNKSNVIFDDTMLAMKLRNQEQKRLILQHVKSAQTLDKEPLTHSITRVDQIKRVFLSKVELFLRDVSTKEIAILYAKRLLQLLNTKNGNKVLLPIGIEALIDDSFYAYFKDMVKRIGYDYANILIEIEDSFVKQGVPSSKLERYLQLGCLIVVKIQEVDSRILKPYKGFEYTWVMLDLEVVHGLIKDPVQKALIQSIISLMLEQHKNIIFTSMSEETKYLLPKEQTVYYIKKNA